jgi:hypothetical protein
VRIGVKATSPLSLAFDHSVWPSLPRMRKAISAPPSSRLAPSQSQPEASAAQDSLDHS